MRLFAIIAKQDDGVSEAKNAYVLGFLNIQVNHAQVTEYHNLYLSFLEEPARAKKKEASKEQPEKKERLTSVTDSVKILGICKKINKTLEQPQKVIVFARLLEFIKSDNSFTDQRLQIIQTVAKVFRIDAEEIASIERFVRSTGNSDLTGNENLLTIADLPEDEENGLFLEAKGLHGSMKVLRAESVNLFFIRYDGNGRVTLNNKPILSHKIYLLAPGAVIDPSVGKTIFYSDIKTSFINDHAGLSLTFEADQIHHKFKSGWVGLQSFTLQERTGTLVGIMGASGAGKTTLLNILSGQQRPTSGRVTINGIDLYENPTSLEGIIGLVPQDDLLFEDLTVFQNLYYNTKLCFRDMPDEEAKARVETVLSDLGLLGIRDLKVGSALSKVISGGQRKRVNIALELVREPSVMFLDEPTSGLSSKDSENVMDLLRELALKGKLVFVVIHQPSSTIFKLFDTLNVLDTGGYLIYQGNPVQGVSYFKRLDHQINHEAGECETCGNVNPETIFDIIESKIVDEYGNTKDKRKVSPAEWQAHFQKDQAAYQEAEPASIPTPVADAQDMEAHRSAKPGKLKQWMIFAIRDLKTKLANRQYLIINLLEAPALALFLAFLLRYTKNGGAEYSFQSNANIPAFIFISIIISTFLGLMVSSEEIIRDRKILKRERFLNLSKSSYLFSKVSILFTISAIQSLLFVVVSHAILEVHGQIFSYWFMLFSVAACSNILGLNISASFNSVVTIYILIPLIIIPQMVLSGAMFQFDRLNAAAGGGTSVPILAHAMPAKWAYESLMVNQFRHNSYEDLFFELDQKISLYDFQLAHVLPELESRGMRLMQLSETKDHAQNDSVKQVIYANLEFMYQQLKLQYELYPTVFDLEKLNLNKLDDKGAAVALADVLKNIEKEASKRFNQHYNDRERILQAISDDPEKRALLNRYKRERTNDAIGELVMNKFAIDQKVVEGNTIIQVSDPIFQQGDFTSGNGFTAPFYASEKGFLGKTLDTFFFNILIIWIMTTLLFASLRLNVLSRLLNSLNDLKLKRKK